MKKRTFITLNTSEAERLRIQQMAEKHGHKSVADFIKKAIDEYNNRDSDYYQKMIKKFERLIFKMIDPLQFHESLPAEQQELLNYLNFCYDLMARLAICKSDKSNYVWVDDESLDINEKPYERYRHAMSINILADIIVDSNFNNRKIEKEYNMVEENNIL